MSVNISVCRYNPSAGYSADFMRVCDFLKKLNRPEVRTAHYPWARWVWQFGPYMNMEGLSQIGMFEQNGEMVGLATYENDLGEAYFCLDEGVPGLAERAVAYALEHLAKDGRVRLLLPDGDLPLQQAAIRCGLHPSAEKSSTARLDIAGLKSDLPEGYRFMDFSDPDFAADRFYAAIWKGFDNRRARNEREQKSMEEREGFDAPGFDKQLKVLAVAPNGDYAAHCGIWHQPGDAYAYIEPVFTLPEYRRKRLGRAVVWEAARRCGQRGASHALVVSNQPFYYGIGFYPIQNETWWEK